MAFAMSRKTASKPNRSHSHIHVATSRDYDRKKLAAKHTLKTEQDNEMLERKMISHAKWNQRVETNNARTNIEQSSTSLDEYIQRERVKQENILNAKRMGNERIRSSSTTTTNNNNNAPMKF